MFSFSVSDEERQQGSSRNHQGIVGRFRVSRAERRAYDVSSDFGHFQSANSNNRLCRKVNSGLSQFVARHPGNITTSDCHRPSIEGTVSGGLAARMEGKENKHLYFYCGMIQKHGFDEVGNKR